MITLNDWADGYAIFTGFKNDIFLFLSKAIHSNQIPIEISLENDCIVFPEDFIPWDLSVAFIHMAYIGMESRHDLQKTDIPDIYSMLISWEQALGIASDELSLLAKAYNLSIEAETITHNLAIKQHILVDNYGTVIFDECIDYNKDDYDPYDEFKKIK